MFMVRLLTENVHLGPNAQEDPPGMITEKDGSGDGEQVISVARARARDFGGGGNERVLL
jgi:hypothetical protein